MLPVIFGCGNADRGDDAAGLLVAARLRGMGIDARDNPGDGLALMEAWAGAECVIIVDAVVSGAEKGWVSVWDAGTAPVGRDFVRASSHAFGVGEAVSLAREMGRLPRSLTIYGIEASRFELGTEPSPEVLAAVEEVAQRIAKVVDDAGGERS